MVHHLPTRLMLAGAVLAVLVAVAALALEPGGRVHAASVLVPFLFAFALFKGAIGIDALLDLRAGGSEGAARIAHHGSVVAVRRWAGYKLAAMAMALIACWVCTRLVI